MAGVPFIFGNATTSIPLSNLDADFNTGLTIGNTTVGLGNTVTTLGNVTLTNVNIVSGTVLVSNSIVNGTSNVVIASSGGNINVGVGGANVITFNSLGNMNFLTSNAGMAFNNSSALANSTLNDYEQGTWTPAQGAGLTVVGSFSSSATYTKIGNIVSVLGILAGSTSISAPSAITILTSNLPFTTINNGFLRPTGGGFDNNGGSPGIVFAVTNTKNLYNCTAFIATPVIYFALVYQATF